MGTVHELRTAQHLAGGLSNSRLRLTSETRTAQAGADTIRLRVRDEGVYERLRDSGTTVMSGSSGEVRLADQPVEGVTVGALPNDMAYVEGRASAILALAGWRDDRRLCSAAEVADAGEVVRDLLEVGPAARVGLGRLDLAAEAVFEDGREGVAFLQALRRLDVPWLKTGTEGERRMALETVYWRNVRGRSVVLRAYDKATESGQGQPGTVIRLERQRRYRKAREVTVEVASEVRWRDLFVGRELSHMLGHEGEHHFVAAPHAIRRLREMALDEAISWRTAESLAGFLQFRGDGLARATRYRRWRQLRDLGLAVSSELLEEEPARRDVCEAVRTLASAFERAA